MSVVIDASVTLAWVYADELTPAVAELFSRIGESGAWAPALWRLEVANVLEMGVRRRRHDAAFRDATLADLALLPIRVDPETNLHAWDATLQLAIRRRLTLYDAAYLELASRLAVPLATLDRDLRAAASAEDIRVVG